MTPTDLRKIPRGSARFWLVTAALIVLPLGGLALVLYGAVRLAARKRRLPAFDPYDEWLRMRDLLRARRAGMDLDDASR